VNPSIAMLHRSDTPSRPSPLEIDLMSAQPAASLTPPDGAAPRARPLGFRDAGAWFAALLAIAIFAFWTPYFSHPFSGPSAATHFHVATMLVWCLLLVVQPWLIRRQRRALHRTLGRLSGLLIVPMLAGFVLLAHERLNAPDGPPQPLRHYILYLQALGLTLFAVSYAGAMIGRRQPLVHARFMVCSGLVLLDPIVARILLFWVEPTPAFPPQFVSYPLTDLILIGLIVLERRAARGRAVFPAMLGLIVVLQVLTFVVTAQPFWADFARWFAAR